MAIYFIAYAASLQSTTPAHLRRLSSLVDYRPAIIDTMMAPNANIEAIIAAASQKGGKVVSAVDRILQMLQEDNLAYRVSLPPALVGIHPANRDGYGVSATEVHELGFEIVDMGWSWLACSHAVCIEADTNGDIAKYSAELKNNSEGLAKCDMQEIRYGSLSCSHTNQFLCCVLAGVPSDIEDLCHDGRMSQGMLSSADIEFGKALTGGLSWIVLKKEVQVMYPTLPDLIQKARNDPGRAQRQEGEVQILLRISTLAKRNSTVKDGETTVDWEAVRKALLKRRLAEPEEAPHLVNFVQKWGGGLNSVFVKDLKEFHKTFVPSGRIIPGAHTTTSIIECQDILSFFEPSINKLLF